MSSRSKEVSAQIGSMLLNGYKMLAESCPKCYNVLMQDKKGVIICVDCNTNSKQDQDPQVSAVGVGDAEHTVGHKLPEHGYSEGIPYRAVNNGMPDEASLAVDVLLNDIKRITSHLSYSEISIGNSALFTERQAHVEYIRKCAETIKALQGIRM